MSDITFRLGAELSGGSKQVFTTMQKGFKDLAKALQESAKELLKLQNTEAANALGHVSMAVNKLAKNLTDSSAKLDGTAAGIKKMDAANKEFAGSSTLVQQVWAKMKKAVEDGSISLKRGVAETRQYQSAMEKLTAQVALFGGTTEDLGKDINLTTFNLKNKNEQLKLVGGQFKNVTTEGYKYLISNEKIRDQVRDLHQSTKEYYKTLRGLEKISFNTDAYAAAAKATQELAKQVGHSEAKFKAIAPIIKNTEQNLTQYGTAQKMLLGTTASWIKDVDRVAIVNQNLVNAQSGVIKHIEVTTKGIKILSSEGMKPFAGLTLDVAQKLGMLDSNFDKFEATLASIGAVTGKSKQEIDELGKTLLASNNSFRQAANAAKEYLNATEQMTKITTKLSVLKDKYSELAAATDRYGNEARELLKIDLTQAGNLEKLSNGLRRINGERKVELAQTKQAKDAYGVLNIQYRRMLQSQTQYGDSARQTIALLNQKGTSINQVKTRMSALHAEMNSLNNITNRLAKSFRTYASYMISSTVIMRTLQGFREMGKAILEYSQGMQDIKAITRATATEMTQLDAALIGVAKNTKFSIGETAAAMKTLGQAGFTAKEVIAGIPNVANLATGTLESLSTAVDLVSTVVYTFRMGMDQTAKVADMFANAVTRSRLTVGKLNIAFNYIGPLAKAAGISLQETAAATMLLANAGLRASTIGTGFRRVLTLLLKPTTAFREAVIAAGYSMDDFNPLMHDFSSIVEKLPNIVQNAQHAVHMFGVRGSSVITAFTTQGAAEFERLKLVLETAGTASWMAAVQMEGLGLALKNMKDRFGVLAVAIGKAGVEDMLKGLVNAARALLNVLIDLAESGVAKWVISLGLMGISAGAAWVALGLMVKLFWKLKLAIAATNVAAAAFLANPIGLALTAIAVLIGALVWQWQKLNRELDETIDQNVKTIGTLETVKDKLAKYNTAVAQNGRYSKQAEEAAKEMREAIEAVGDSTGRTAEFTEKFGDAIDENSGRIKDAQQFSKDLADTLDEDLAEGYNTVAIAAAKAFEAQRIDNVLDTLKQTYRDFNLITIGTWLGIEAAAKRSKAIMRHNSSSLADMQKAADAGNKSAERALETLTKNANMGAVALLKNRDAAKLTTEEIKQMAKEWAELNKGGKAQEEAMVKVLTNVGIKTQENMARMKEMSTELVGTINRVRDNFMAIEAMDTATINNKKRLMDVFRIQLKDATDEELKFKRAVHNEEVAIFKGTLDQRKDMEERHRADILFIQKQGLDAEQALYESLQLNMMKVYSEQIANAEKYYQGNRDILNFYFELEKTEHANLLNAKLHDIDLHYTDVEKKREASSRATLESYYVQMQASEQYHEALSRITEDEYKTRISATNTMGLTLVGEENKVKEEVAKLSLELLQKQRENLVARGASVAEMANKVREIEKSLSLALASEVEKRRQQHLSFADKMRELQYKTLNEKQIHDAEVMRAEKVASEARQALARGEFALAQEKAKQAQDIYASIGNSIKKADDDTGAYARQIANVGQRMTGVQEIWDKASVGIGKNIEKNQNEFAQLGNTLDVTAKSVEQDLERAITAVQKLGLEKIDLDVTKALASIQSVIDKVDAIKAKKIELGITPETTQAVADLNDSLDEVEEPRTTEFLGKNSTILPLREKLAEIKAALIDTFDPNNIDQSLMSMVLTFKGNAEGSEVSLLNALHDIAEALKSVKEYLVFLQSLDIKVAIEITQTEEALQKIAEITEKLQELVEEAWKAEIKIEIFGLDELAKTWTLWENLLKSPPEINKTVNIKENVERTTTNKPGFAVGSRIPGYGGGDVIDAKLEPGEWVIRKEAVQKYGDSFLHGINSMQMSIPKFKTGGPVSSDMQKRIDELQRQIELMEWQERMQNAASGTSESLPYVPPPLPFPTTETKKAETSKKEELPAIEKVKTEAEWLESKRKVYEKMKETGVNDTYRRQLESEIAKADRDLERAEKAKKGSGGGVSQDGSIDVSWAKVVGPYQQSGNVSDLYTAINYLANLLDVDLTNIGLAMSAGVAGTSLMAGGGIMSAPQDIYRGFYGPTGSQQSDKPELAFIMSKATKALSTGAISGHVSYQSNEHLKKLLEMWNSYMGLPLNDLLRVQEPPQQGEHVTHDAKAGSMQAGWGHNRRIPTNKEKEAMAEFVSQKPGDINSFTGWMSGSDMYDETGKLLDWEEMRKKATKYYQDGGPVMSAMNSYSPSAASNIQKGAKAVSQPSGPSHTVNFKLGGEVHGPFTGDGPTVESFIETLRIHQMRS